MFLSEKAFFSLSIIISEPIPAHQFITTSPRDDNYAFPNSSEISIKLVLGPLDVRLSQSLEFEVRLWRLDSIDPKVLLF